MSLENQIYKRKSCRRYLDEEVDLNLVKKAVLNAKPLNEDIEYYYKIFKKDEVNLKTRWSAPYYLAVYSKRKDNYLENIGFVFQQVCLYLQKEGIGNCWVGMASLKEKNSDFVIAISFGKSNDMIRSREKFKRKDLSEISDMVDDRLSPAQLAPSAINSQPWYFKHSGDSIDVYQVKQNFLKRQILKKWNPIDVGIALAHLYVSNPDSFEFFIKNDFENNDNGYYVGSIKIGKKED